MDRRIRGTTFGRIESQTRAVLANRIDRSSGDFFQKKKSSRGFDFYVTFVSREEAAPRLIDREIKGALVSS